jgi:hypothetical protein
VKRCLQQEPILQHRPEAGCFIPNPPQASPRGTVTMRNTNTVIYSQDGLFSQRTQTSLDWIRAISDGQHLIHLDWNQTGWTDHDRLDDVSRETITQLTAYLQGGLRCFDLPLQPTGASQSRRVLPALPVLPTRYRLFILVIRYCEVMGSLAIMAAAVICHQHIRIIYNGKRFLSAMRHSSLISNRQKMPNLTVHLVKEIIIAL